MSLLTIVITLILVGLALWLINQFIPIDAKIKTLLNVVIIIVLVIWLLKCFGIWGYVANVHV